MTRRSPKGYLHRDKEESTVSVSYSRSRSTTHNLLHNKDHIQSQCHLNTTVNSSIDNLASTLRTIVPPPEQFESGFRNPCWYSHLNLPLKVNKVLQATRGNISDAEAFNLMNLIFSSSHRGGDGKFSQNATPPRTLVCVPKVYFIGFPRSGSTQLYKMLVSHPDLAGGLNKEPHWWTRYMFSSKFPHNILSVIRYLSHFREASEQIINHTQQLLIDGSQSTVWDVRTTNNFCALPHLITSIIPSAKFIVLMRNPVDRLFSDFRYLCEEALRIKLHKAKSSHNKTLSDREDPSGNLTLFSVSADVFHEVVQEEIESFNKCLETGNSLDICTHLSTATMPRQKSQTITLGVNNECSRVRLGISLYHVHLKRWLKVIPKERMLFLRTEDMSEDPYALLERIWQFLDIKRQDREELNNILYKHSHPSLMGYGNSANGTNNITMHQKTRDLLVEFFKPHNLVLNDLLGWKDRIDWTENG